MGETARCIWAGILFIFLKISALKINKIYSLIITENILFSVFSERDLVEEAWFEQRL
jgi:hypothetical protein